MSCPDCFSGSTHEGNPSGEVTTLHGLEVYIAKPAGDIAPRGIIIIIPDAFGWEFINNRLLADHYAERGGYLVYLPEFMNGHAASLTLLNSTKEVLKTSGVIGWIKAPYYVASIIYALAPFAYYNGFGSTGPVVNAFFKGVRDNEGAELPVYAAGFCWGGKHTVNLASGVETSTSGKPLIDAGFTGHPSRQAAEAEDQALAWFGKHRP
ncbi:Dienelactone hydrolase [Arthroderma uncinatum]|uniref:Dienelactone hydrolase n=1 Tax=Arthroderma uncinatum TaxID=74035 RepID=UPI00144A9751|nr:Dienelactone hydrolase [Arthroderma uncinatum]KAF3492409.1 Dienelactone hydrolase [Arthroderma uncinatum]